MASARQVQQTLRRLANPAKEKIYRGFFKTGPGQYGEGDRFLGVTMPQNRKIAKQFSGLPLTELGKLVRSPFHEERLCALLILLLRFQKAPAKEQTILYRFLMKNKKYINNWDLVDVIIPGTAGAYLYKKDRSILFKLAESKSLWDRRIAVLATFYFIRQNDFRDTLALAKKFLRDPHDLMHKASGWMLREIGKRDENVLKDFLARHYREMPRTMLRYAIEKFSKPEQQMFLKGEICVGHC